MGSEVYLHFTVEAPPVRAKQVMEAAETEAIAAAAARAGGTPFIARVDRTTRAREGRKVELFVVTRRLHFFDLENGRGIYGESDDAGKRNA
jgi:multiple sugar transport system ATP-binding protein